MIVGIDLHGVLDHDPEQFRAFIDALKQNDGGYYILTGMERFEAEKELRRLGFTDYIGLYSVTSYLKNRGYSYVLDKHGRPSFDPKKWDGCKAVLAKILNLDAVIDDTMAYSEYFPDRIEFILYQKGTLYRNFIWRDEAI